MPEYTFPGVYVEEQPARGHTIEGVPTSTAAFLGATARGPLRPTCVASFAEYADVFGDPSPGFLSSSVRGFFDNGGERLYVARVTPAMAGPLTSSDYCGRACASRAELQGLAALDHSEYDDVSIVHAPGVPFDIARVLIDHCDAVRFRFAVIDGPPQVDANFDPRAALAESSRAALYVPWLVVEDPVAAHGRRTVPPGGHVVGIYARNDRERGVHRAPANEAVRGVCGLAQAISRRQQDVLNPLGVNVIRDFGSEGRGIRVWGSRTLSSSGEFRYVSVRRLLSYIEQSIAKGTRWVTFETNGELLWQHLRRNIENFLVATWRHGALAGQTPDEAFYVRCDCTTMTQDDLDQGRLICEIGVAPVRPAEFVVFRLFQNSTR